jgi:hypothetical protein
LIILYKSKENVYLIREFFDEIRAGFADYQSRPHYFREGFEVESDSYTGEFLIEEVDEAIRELAIEANEIQGGYWTAYRRGRKEGDQCHRVLP